MEKGSGSVLVVAATAVILAATLAVVAATQVVATRARAVAAADAAALAAAVNTFPPAADRASPRLAASDLAAANGAQVVGCSCLIDSRVRPRAVEVRVIVVAEVILVGKVPISASSRAEYIP